MFKKHVIEEKLTQEITACGDAMDETYQVDKYKSARKKKKELSAIKNVNCPACPKHVIRLRRVSCMTT